MPIGKTLTDELIADRRHTEPLFPDCGEILLQLHELDFTERSPIGGAEEDPHGAFRPHNRLQGRRAPVLTCRGKRRNLLNDLGTGLDVLRVERSHLPCPNTQPSQIASVFVSGICMFDNGVKR